METNKFTRWTVHRGDYWFECRLYIDMCILVRCTALQQTECFATDEGPKDLDTAIEQLIRRVMDDNNLGIAPSSATELGSRVRNRFFNRGRRFANGT